MATWQREESSNGSPRQSPPLGSYNHIPLSWEGHDLDSIYEALAFHVRGNYCKHLSDEMKTSGWCEAWLLKPDRWPVELEVNTENMPEDRRRLLVTLHMACPSGEKCVRSLVKRTRIDVIPRHVYRDHEALAASTKQLVEDISLPFRAPCIVAEERIEGQSYEYRTFGK